MDVAKEEIVKTEELETRYERYKGILKDLTIMSDVFMRNVFKKRECTEYVLQVIMEKRIGGSSIRFCRKIIKTYRDVQLYWIVLSEMLMENRWMWKSSRIMKVHLQREPVIIAA